MENLTPQQLEDYDNAYMLAHEASVAYDHRREVATALVTSTDLSATLSNFEKADNTFELLYKAASVLMPPREVFQDPEPFEPFASESVWSTMTREQKIRANEVRSTIAERFKDYGVTADSLRVVMNETEEGKKVFTLIHTGNGVDIGDHSQDYDEARSYKSVTNKKNDPLFKVEVNGKVYDTRSGMTATAYDALYEEAKADEAIILPDSQKASVEFNDVWTSTMLTGEPLTADGYVQVRDVDDRGVDRRVDRPDVGFRSRRVRPAAVIE